MSQIRVFCMLFDSAQVRMQVVSNSHSLCAYACLKSMKNIVCALSFLFFSFCEFGMFLFCVLVAFALLLK